MQEQKLKDGALIATYGSERRFDIAREKDAAVLEARKKTLTARVPDVEKFLAKMTKEMEFYKGRSSSCQGSRRQAGRGHQQTQSRKRPKNQKPKEARRRCWQIATVPNKQGRPRRGICQARHRKEGNLCQKNYEGEKNRWKRLKSGMIAGTLINEQGETIAVPGMATQIVGQSTVIPGRLRGMAGVRRQDLRMHIGLDYICRARRMSADRVSTSNSWLAVRTGR